jgi:hypothetical protein
VKASKAADGTLTALQIKLDKRQGPKNERVDFSGPVEAISGSSWTIGGKVVAITPQTVITGTIAVGDKVKVTATKAADGTLTALTIKLESTQNDGDHQGGSSDGQGDHQGGKGGGH